MDLLIHLVHNGDMKAERNVGPDQQSAVIFPGDFGLIRRDYLCNIRYLFYMINFSTLLLFTHLVFMSIVELQYMCIQHLKRSSHMQHTHPSAVYFVCKVKLLLFIHIQMILLFYSYYIVQSAFTSSCQATYMEPKNSLEKSPIPILQVPQQCIQICNYRYFFNKDTFNY